MKTTAIIIYNNVVGFCDLHFKGDNMAEYDDKYLECKYLQVWNVKSNLKNLSSVFERLNRRHIFLKNKTENIKEPKWLFTRLKIKFIESARNKTYFKKLKVTAKINNIKHRSVCNTPELLLQTKRFLILNGFNCIEIRSNECLGAYSSVTEIWERADEMVI